MALATSATPRVEITFEEESLYAISRVTEATAARPEVARFSITIYHYGGLQLSQLGFSHTVQDSEPITASFRSCASVYTYSGIGRPLVLSVVRLAKALHLDTAQARVGRSFPAQGPNIVTRQNLTSRDTTLQHALKGLLGAADAQRVYDYILNSADNGITQATTSPTPYSPAMHDLA
ncbi:hypothetical protein MPER_13192 [Moniliophthora perniciosa FA553]|nr:hypothetical protein MPER_13192 [Moniliophthora perniciosa FA553]